MDGMGWVLHLQEVGMIVCTINHTALYPFFKSLVANLGMHFTLLSTFHTYIIGSLVTIVTSLQFLIILSYT